MFKFDQQIMKMIHETWLNSIIKTSRIFCNKKHISSFVHMNCFRIRTCLDCPVDDYLFKVTNKNNDWWAEYSAKCAEANKRNL